MNGLVRILTRYLYPIRSIYLHNVGLLKSELSDFDMRCLELLDDERALWPTALYDGPVEIVVACARRLIFEDVWTKSGGEPRER